MDIFNVPLIRELNLDLVEPGKVSRFWVQLATDGIGMPIAVPVMVAKGHQPGPVIGLTAAVHGNELNGLPVIQKLFSEIELENLKGTIVGVLVANVPGLIAGQRKFNDGTDLNHIMPGKPDGNNSEVYAHRLVERIVNRFEYLIDLHTASFGRVNTYYIRADMHDPVTKKMALLQNADIIVHNPPKDGTLRGAADDLGIPAITLEVGDPNRFQKGMIRSSMTGIYNFLVSIGVQEGEIETLDESPHICNRSYWLYTQGGGLLTVTPDLGDIFTKGECIGYLRNIFGDKIKDYYAPENGVLIGKSVHPVAQSGSRILHLGIFGETETK